MIENKCHDAFFIEVPREQWVKTVIDWELAHI